MAKVYLIGAGPFDDELITIKAIRKLKECTAVVYDRLISTNILNYLKEDCVLYYVGKEPGKHSKSQHEINKLIVDLAKKGETVARLKGGDPYVFGRGGEEALELLKEGIDFQVIPGVTSAVSVLSYAGIPITHRGISQGFHVFTGKSVEELKINWESLSKSDDTLVFLMGLKNIEALKNRLLENGKSLNSKCAVIMKGTSSKQKKVIGTLEDICTKVAIAGFKSPCIIVIGEVVSLSENLNWYEKMPLFGAKACITRSKNSNEGFKYKLKDLGAEVIEVNTIKFRNLSENLFSYKEKLGEYQHIIITSTKAVEIFFNYLIHEKIDVRSLKAKFYVTGKTTDKTLRERGIIPFFTSDGSKEGIFNRIGKVAKKGENLLYPTSKKSIGVESFRELAKEVNFNLDVVILYDTIKEKMHNRIDFNEIDFIVFNSPSSVKNFVEEYEREKFKDKRAVVIGETTKNVAKKYFNGEIFTSKEATEEGIIKEILRIWRETK